MTALIPFGIPLLVLAIINRYLGLRWDARSIGLILAYISAALGAIGQIPTSEAFSCAQEYAGCTLAAISLLASLFQLRKGRWPMRTLLLLDVYLVIAWSLLITACRHAP
jgi:hypothetical protein